jgi:hypothetical protein
VADQALTAVHTMLLVQGRVHKTALAQSHACSAAPLKAGTLKAGTLKAASLKAGSLKSRDRW